MRTAGDLKRFIDVAYRLNARDPNWVPPLRRDMHTLLSRTKNPFFEHAEAEYFLAERGGELVGRIAGIANRLHNETHHDTVGFFGFFETIDDPDIARALLDAAAGWLGPRGFDIMRGPASFSVNDECGLLVEGFDRPNTIMMPHNPPYYVNLLQSAGFTKAKGLLAYEGGHAEHYAIPPERIHRAVEIGMKRYGVTLRPLNMKDFRGEIDRVKLLYNRCWESNWGAIPMTDHEIDHLADQFKPVINANLVPFAEIAGQPVGFGLALPDFNQVLKNNKQGRMLPAVLQLLWALKRKTISRTRILLLGVLPEHRGKGIDAMLYHWVWSKAGADGMFWGEAGWILEDNPAMIAGLLKMNFHHYKTYWMVERPIAR